MNTYLPIRPKEDEMKYKTSVFMGTSQDLFGSHKRRRIIALKVKHFYIEASCVFIVEKGKVILYI